MSDENGRPASLVPYSVLFIGAMIGGGALYGFAGQQFTDWFVHTAMPKIQEETEDQFHFESVETNFGDSTPEWGESPAFDSSTN
jgi:hypothetical protein